MTHRVTISKHCHSHLPMYSPSIVTKAASSDSILGVSAEEHSGVSDILNTRADGTKIRVIISPDGVYRVNAPEYTAKDGSENSLTVASAGLSVNTSCAYAVLVYKNETSLNTDKPGTARKINSCSISGENAVISLEEGGKICEGDVYALIPEAGSEVYPDQSGKGICFYRNDAPCKLICVCTDKDAKTCGVKLQVLI